MYRISAMTVCAVVIGLSLGGASAQSCDARIADACPIEPALESAEPETDAAELPLPLSYARAGAEGRAKRVRRATRHVARPARRKTVRAVAFQQSRRKPAAVAEIGAQPGSASSVPESAPVVAAAPPAAMSAPPTATGSPAMPGAASLLSPAFTPDAGGGPSQPIGEAIQLADTRPVGSDYREPASVTGSVPARAASDPGVAAPSVRAGPGADAEVVAPLPADPPQQAAMSNASEPADSSWLRAVILAFGGLLAVGSAVRMLV